MSRETVTRCCKCKREDCDGKLWLIDHDSLVGEFTVCTSETEIRDGKRKYHYVMGHGSDWWIDVKDIRENEKIPR